MTQLTKVKLTGVGAALPAQVLSNEDLAKFLDTSDAWIYSRTGIRQRHILEANRRITDLAVQAGKAALAQADVTPEQVDLILLATSTPDDLFGSAPEVQAGLGAHRAVAFDLSAACSGFVFALVTAAQYLRTGTYRRILVIAADALSRTLDWSDRSICVLFGDGAGALLLEAEDTDKEDGLLGFELRTDGTGASLLRLEVDPSQVISPTEDVTFPRQAYRTMTMNGREVYRFVASAVPEVIEKALFRSGLSLDQVDHVILHQANQRIIEAVAQRLNIAPEKMVSHIATCGNTSAASIPIALAAEMEMGRIQAGATLVMAGFGAGLSWGAAVVRLR
ncbi:MAG: beta-ketoacyl-ACP synthase III [Gloeobacterales cyanobacterium]